VAFEAQVHGHGSIPIGEVSIPGFIAARARKKRPQSQ